MQIKDFEKVLKNNYLQRGNKSVIFYRRRRIGNLPGARYLDEPLFPPDLIILSI